MVPRLRQLLVTAGLLTVFGLSAAMLHAAKGNPMRIVLLVDSSTAMANMINDKSAQLQ